MDCKHREGSKNKILALVITLFALCVPTAILAQLVDGKRSLFHDFHLFNHQVNYAPMKTGDHHQHNHLHVEKWTMELAGGLNYSEVNDLASTYGCINRGLVPGTDNVYLLEKRTLVDYRNHNHMHRVRRQLSKIHRRLVSEPLVAWVDRQTPVQRFKRDSFRDIAAWRKEQKRILLKKMARIIKTVRSKAAAKKQRRKGKKKSNQGQGRRHPSPSILSSNPFASLSSFSSSSSASRLQSQPVLQQAQQPTTTSRPTSPMSQTQQFQGQPSAAQPSQAQPQDNMGNQQLSSKPQMQSHHMPSALHANVAELTMDRGMYATLAQSVTLKKFNDELWMHQWYLQDNANVAQMQGDVELRVAEVWKMGYTGKGVVVSVLDDGLEWNHTDIWPNYDKRASWDMNNNKSDPFPRYDDRDTNNHGTRCAGEIAMAANNRKCGVGVAPQARIGGIKCIDGGVDDIIELMSLLHNVDYIDIYSGSWGPEDSGELVEGPKRLASYALESGVRRGRRGKGALYIWANGNGGALGDNCNCDGYVNSIYTISIGGVTQQGQMPFYGEKCASTLAVTCSSGAYTDRKIVTTDLHNKCTIDYTGTSAAAPLAAGIYALVLQANPNITWRDAQHLAAWTSDPIPLRSNKGWRKNKAGLMYNSRFGFGLMNAHAMVLAALRWQSVPKKSICRLPALPGLLPKYLQSRGEIKLEFITDGCQGLSSSSSLLRQRHRALRSKSINNSGNQKYITSNMNGESIDNKLAVNYLEHVQVSVDIEYTRRGALDVFLVSPGGTVSTLLTRRPLDLSQQGFDNWHLMSVHFWGEAPAGKWTLIVRDKESMPGTNKGMLRNATLILHGTTERPAHMAGAKDGAPSVKVYAGEQNVGSFLDSSSEFDDDDLFGVNANFANGLDEPDSSGGESGDSGVINLGDVPNDLVSAVDDSYEPAFFKSLIASKLQQAARRTHY